MSTLKKTILLVEDETITAMIEKNILESNNYNVIIAKDGEKSIDIVKQQFDKIDLILMDIDLGKGIDGTEAARLILKEFDIPLIFLSSHTEPEVVEKTEGITSYGYIVKNTGETVLIASIRMAFKLFDEKTKRKTSENVFQNMLKVIPDMISIHDKDMNIVYSNWNGFGEIPEQKRKLNTKCYETYRGYNEICPDCKAKNVLKTEKPFQIQTQLPDESWIDLRVIPIFDTNKKVSMFVEWVKDITDRRQTEETIRIDRENLSITLDSIGDAVISTDIDGKITRMNPVAEKLCGWSLKEAYGEPLTKVFNIINAHSRKQVRNPVEIVIEKSKTVGLANHTVLISKNGDEYQISDSAAPIKNHEGKIVGVVMVFSDVTESYKLRQEIKENLLLKETLHNTIPNPIFYKDLNLKYIGCNKAFQNFLEIPLKDIVGKSVYDIAPKKIADKHFNSDQELLKNLTPVTYECIMETNSGVLRNLVFNKAVYKDKEGKPAGIVGIIEVITERKKVEEELKKFKEISDNANYGIAMSDLEGNLSYLNHYFARIHGYEPHELIGKNLEIFHTPKQFEKVLEANKILVKDGKFNAQEIWHVDKNGREFPMLMNALVIRDPENGKPKFLSTTAIDLTSIKAAESERKLLETSQKKQNALVNSLINATPDIIFFKDLDGVYLGCNSEFAKHVGIKQKEIIGKTDYDLYSKQEANKFRKNDKLMLEKLRARRNKEWISYPDGKKVLLDTLKTPYKDENQNLIGILGVSRDITDYEKKEKELRKSKENIKKQLIEKEVLLRETHHRIKNHIFSIEALLNLQKENTENSEVVQALNDALSRIESMRILYENLLISDNKQLTSVKKYLDRLIDSIVTLNNESSNISIQKNITDFKLNSNKLISLGIIINELMTNVYKYAFQNKESGNVSINLNKNKNHITLIIQDNGIGIDNSNYAHSEGIGITLIKMLTESLKGKLSIVNNKGTKTTIVFEL